MLVSQGRWPVKKILFTLIFGILTNATYAQGPPQKKSPPPHESPQVEILIQPDSPLRIAKVETKWVLPDHRGIELYFVVENVSTKTISAYTLRDDGADTGNCTGYGARSPGKALRPQQSEGRSTWQYYNPASPPRRLVDFVEFTDGSTWGADVCQTAEGLAAGRAGARAARKLLLEIFAAEGAEAVGQILKSHLTAEPPENQSLKWKERFILGFQGYAEMIRQAYQEWGSTEIEHALKRPISPVVEK